MDQPTPQMGHLMRSSERSDARMMVEEEGNEKEERNQIQTPANTEEDVVCRKSRK